MKKWKNPELRRELIWYIGGAIGLTAAGYWIEPICGLLCLGGGLFFTTLHWWMARRRYRAIAGLSQGIDRILHGQDKVLITESSEGELSILRSEIQKMTIRLQEAADMLLADKHRLMDAMADVSHQLRTPLTSMNLMVSMLSEENLTLERRIGLARELRKQLQRIEWLVETLLKMSKIDAGTVVLRKESIAVATLIQKAIEPLTIPMEVRGQTLRVSVQEERWNGDLLWTTEALGNVLKNCMEHTPVGGDITISVTETVLFTEIIVQDSGNGFAKEDIPYLFDRFYKGKKAATESVGIGLAFARMVIAAQNGTIQADNAPEGGAQFTIRFYKSVV